MTGSTGGSRPPSDPHPRMPAWLGDLIAVVLVVLLAFAPSPDEQFDPPVPLTFVLAGLAAGVLLLRRRWPVPVLGTTIALFAVASFFGVVSPGLGLAVGIAMFGVTNRTPRRTGLIITAIAVVAVVGFSLVPVIGSMTDARFVQFGLIVLVGAATGDATRSRREFIAAMVERAERAEQTREAEAQRRVSEERLKIARDLHDVVAHQIAVISLNAGVASSVIDTRPEKAKESLATIRGAARTVLGEIGDLLEVLRADDESPAAPQPGLDRLDDLVRQFGAAGLDVTTRVEGDVSDVTGATGVVAYRVIQEALTNAHKHGAEHRAHVLLARDEASLSIVVTNPIAETADSPAPPGSRLGLIGLRERVATVRGTVETGPAPGGWRLTARLPLATEGDA